MDVSVTTSAGSTILLQENGVGNSSQLKRESSTTAEPVTSASPAPIDQGLNLLNHQQGAVVGSGFSRGIVEAHRLPAASSVGVVLQIKINDLPARADVTKPTTRSTAVLLPCLHRVFHNEPVTMVQRQGDVLTETNIR